MDRDVPDECPELSQGLEMEGEDVLHVEDDPALDQLQLLQAREEAGLGEEGGDLGDVWVVPEEVCCFGMKDDLLTIAVWQDYVSISN